MDPIMLVTIGILVIYMIFAFRTQKKRADEAQNMLNSIQPGSHVVTVGGLHGVVSEVNDDTIVLDCEGIYLTFERRAVNRVVEGPAVVSSLDNDDASASVDDPAVDSAEASDND